MGRIFGDSASEQSDEILGREDDVFWILDLDSGVWSQAYPDLRPPNSR